MAVVRTNTMRNILMLCLDSTKMALVGVVVINYILVPKKQKLEAATTVSKYKSERASNAEHCSIHIFSFSLLQTCSIVFITFSSYLKHPNKSFLIQYIYLDIFLTHTLYYTNYINIYFLIHFNVNILLGEQSEEESATTSKHPNNKERTKNGIYSFSHVALSSKHNSSNSSNTSSNSNHSNTGDDRYGEVMSTKTGWLSERGVQIVLQSDDAKMKKQIDSSTIDVLPFPPPETNEPSILDQKIDEAHQRQKRSLRIRTMGGTGGSGIASKSANSMSLVASLREHEANKSITTVVSSSQFFLTGSNDGTLKIWHSRGPRSMLEGGHHSVATHRFKQGSKPIGTDATVVRFEKICFFFQVLRIFYIIICVSSIY